MLADTAETPVAAVYDRRFFQVSERCELTNTQPPMKMAIERNAQ
jgi:hypothetical protein